MVKLIPFEKLLKMSKEKIDEAMAPIRANKVRKKAEFEMAKLEEKMVTLEAKIHELCIENDPNFDQIIETMDKYDLAERRQKQFAKIIEGLFPKK